MQGNQYYYNKYYINGLNPDAISFQCKRPCPCSCPTRRRLGGIIRPACKCRSIVFVFLILLFFLLLFVPATGPLKQHLKTGCSESDQTWQSGRSP